MDPRQLEIARQLRKMSDADAFDFLVNGIDNPVQRRRLVGHRPWRKQFHRPLASVILPEVRRDGFSFVIKAFLTFMKPTVLSQELWIATKDDPADRDLAGYYFVIQAVGRLGKDHPTLERWLSGQLGVHFMSEIASRNIPYALLGRWRADYDSDDARSEYTIAIVNGQLQVTGIDYLDDESYVISKVAHDPTQVSFDTLMPSTGRKGHLVLHLLALGAVEMTFTFTDVCQAVKVEDRP